VGITHDQKTKFLGSGFCIACVEPSVVVGTYAYSLLTIDNLGFNATRDRGQKTEDCTVVNEGLVSR
jgi:hypothetical protein